MKSLADTLPAISPERSAADTASIAASWDTLAEALEAGTISDGQFQWVMDREPPDVDTEVDALVRNLWARQLARWATDPRGISADPDSLKTYPCKCGPGYGWVFTLAPSPVTGVETMYAAPCPDCNRRQRALWLDHWRLGGDHVCPECKPRGGRTDTPLAGDKYDQAASEQKAAAREADLAEAAMMTLDGLR